MKKHFSNDGEKTACGRKITEYAINNWRPTIWYFSDWDQVDCRQCLRQKVARAQIPATTKGGVMTQFDVNGKPIKVGMWIIDLSIPEENPNPATIINLNDSQLKLDNGKLIVRLYDYFPVAAINK